MNYRPKCKNYKYKISRRKYKKTLCLWVRQRFLRYNTKVLLIKEKNELYQN